MNQEIERKFLVKNEAFKKEAQQEIHIVQAFISSHPDRMVRIRKSDENAFISIKGSPSSSGISRFEWEKELSLADADQLLELCEDGRISKSRYVVPVGKHRFEVDVFHGENEGLILAEIELSHEEEEFDHPHWLGEEVTGQAPYYNANLSRNPYKNW